MPKQLPSSKRFWISAAFVGLDPIGALVHVQLGRVFVLSGDKTGARAAYQDFLSLWKEPTLTLRF
jgi:hypothetical protein